MKRYIVVDDDATNNLICNLIIKKFEPTAEVKLFTDPEEALKFIKNEQETIQSVLLLDINMPTMTGWEFLAEFNTLEKELQKKYFIYILSSSYEDLNRNTMNYPFLYGFYSKPLKLEYLQQIKLYR